MLRLKKIVDNLTRDLNAEKLARKEDEQLATQLRADNEVFTTRYKDLKQEVETLKTGPLVQIGLSIRLRFLESARVLLSGDPTDRLDPAIIRRGNEAAHAGHAQADALVFRGAYLEAHGFRRKKLAAAFESLYHAKPSSYTPESPRMQEATNMAVTIRTLTPVRDVEMRPIRERETALTNYEYIRDAYAKMSTEDFERDEQVGRRLGVMREMKEVIARADRWNRPDGMERRTSTSY